MIRKAGPVTSHDITLVVFQWIIKQDYKNKYLVTGDWIQSNNIFSRVVNEVVYYHCVF